MNSECDSSGGAGRTLLLHVLARRLDPRFHCVFLPYGAVDTDELCRWALGLLELALDPDEREAPNGSEPRAELLAAAAVLAERGARLLLVIDDVSSMPIDTARGLGGLIRASAGTLQVALGSGDDAASSRVIVALTPEVLEVRFTEPMTLRETRLYLHTRLEQAGLRRAADECFGRDAVGWVHRLSGGVPRRVHELAASLLNKSPVDVSPVWLRDEASWLGEEIDDSALEWPDNDVLTPDDVTEAATDFAAEAADFDEETAAWDDPDADLEPLEVLVDENAPY